MSVAASSTIVPSHRFTVFICYIIAPMPFGLKSSRLCDSPFRPRSSSSPSVIMSLNGTERTISIITCGALDANNVFLEVTKVIEPRRVLFVDLREFLRRDLASRTVLSLSTFLRFLPPRPPRVTHHWRNLLHTPSIHYLPRKRGVCLPGFPSRRHLYTGDDGGKAAIRGAKPIMRRSAARSVEQTARAVLAKRLGRF